MKTALDLLNEIMELGFDQRDTLLRIDKILDKRLGIDGRKPLLDEELSDVIYDDILGIFLDEVEKKEISTDERLD